MANFVVQVITCTNWVLRVITCTELLVVQVITCTTDILIDIKKLYSGVSIKLGHMIGFVVVFHNINRVKS